jgi:hypothetical protein
MWTALIDPSSPLGQQGSALLESLTETAIAKPSLDACMLLAFRAVAEGKRGWLKLAVEFLNQSIATADELYSTRRLELFGGLSGLGLAIEQIRRQLQRFQGSTISAPDLCHDIDAALLLELQRGRWQGSYDLASGVTGLGIYFLQRLPDGRSKEGVELVAAHLEDAAQRAVLPCTPGTLAFLAEAETKRSDVALAKLLRMLPGQKSDLALAVVCLAAAAPHTGTQMLEGCLASTAPGGPSVAHLWNRAFQRTGDPRCRSAALQEWQRSLESYEKETPAEGAAGVRFLAGPAGVGLALLAALLPVEPDWDRFLGLPARY